MKNNNSEIGNNDSFDASRKNVPESGIFNLDPKNEIEEGPKEKLIGAFNGIASNVSNSDKRKEFLTSKAFKKEEEEEPMTRIAGNINAEHKSVDESKIGGKTLPIVGKKKNRNLITLVILIAVAAIVLVGFAAFYFLGKQVPRHKEESPQQIIKSSTEAISKAKTYTFDGNMKVDALIKPKLTSAYQSPYPQDLNFTYNIAMSGKVDQTDVDNPKSSTSMKLEADFSGEGGSQKFYFDLDAVSIGQKAAYYRLNDYDLGMIGMMLGPQISEYKGKWYALDMEEMKKSAGADSAYNFSVGNYDMNKIRELYKKYELIKFQKDLGDTKLGGADVYHYQLKLDGIALANFYIDLLKEMIKPENENEISKKSFEEMLLEFKDGVEKYKSVIDKIVNNINVEAWIGKNDRLIYKMKIDGKFDKKFFEMIEEEMIAKEKNLVSEIQKDRLSESIDDMEIKFDMYFDMNDFNKPVEINEPEGAESLLEVFKTLGGLTSDYGVTRLDSDEDGLTDDVEAFYGTDKNNPDTDGDGYKDGEEVNNGYDPLLPGGAKLDYDKLFNVKR